MKNAKYIRLFNDSDGASHFEDIEVPLRPKHFAPPAPPLNIGNFLDASQTLWVGAPSGWDGREPHPSPKRQLFITLQGEYEVTASDGTVRRFPQGSVLLLEDTSGQGHVTKICGGSDVLIFGVVLGPHESPG